MVVGVETELKFEGGLMTDSCFYESNLRLILTLISTRLTYFSKKTILRSLKEIKILLFQTNEVILN